MPRLLFGLTLLLVAPAAAAAVQEGQGFMTNGGQPRQDGTWPYRAEGRKLTPPRVFLDKSRRVVEYQLRRLDDARLLMVERDAEDPQYAPVHAAILRRPGVSNNDRAAALDALVALNGSDPVTELLAALRPLKTGDERAVKKLTDLLLGRPAEELKAKAEALQEAAVGPRRPGRVAAYAALIAAGEQVTAPDNSAEWLLAVPKVPGEKTRAALRGEVVRLLGSGDVNVRRAAVEALAAVPAGRGDTFTRLAKLLGDPALRPAAVRTLLTVPSEDRDPAAAAGALETLVALAEDTPAADRTTDDFLNAMQLADGLVGRVDANRADALRARLREVAVRVVVVKTVEEEMRYDKPYFAVEAGRPVQILLENEDLMPHNLVVSPPGMLRQAAARGAEVGPSGGKTGLAYVADGSEVLFATDMIAAGGRERLTFTAPEAPGEYPYVCTFPNHWPRMYGVMVVVPDLGEWQRNPTVPADPLGNDRTFVADWAVADFVDQESEENAGRDLEARLASASAEKGQRIFTEAGCVQCHKAEGTDSLVGPSLVGVFGRWKGDPAVVLREILHPSEHIDPRYAVRTILTVEGQVLTGLVTAERDDAVAILVDPAGEPQSVARDEILDMAEADVSMMPKALMNRYTDDEVVDLLAYLESLTPADAPAGLAPRSELTGPAEEAARTPAGPRTKGTGAVSSAGPPNDVFGDDRPRTFGELKDALAERDIQVFVPSVEPAEGVRIEEGVTYVTRKSGPLGLDLYLPAGLETAGEEPPLVVLIHGGAWRRGDRGQERNKGVWLANRGYAAASVSYRLAGDAPFPAAIDDVLDAVRFLRRESETYGFDADRVAAVGSSAGAHLAALLATAADPAAGQEGVDEVSAAVQAAVVIAGPTDTEGERAKAQSREPDSNYRLFLGGTYDEVPGAYAAASPAHWATTDTPPLLLVGEGDMTDFEGLTGSLDRLGVAYETFLLTGGLHGEWNWEPWFTPTMQRIDAFLTDALARDGVRGR